MNIPITIAAGLTVLLALAHSYLGERLLLIPLSRRSDLPPLGGSTELAKQTLRLAWHITSVLALAIAAILLTSATGSVDARSSGVIIAVANAACGLIALVTSRGRHLSWIVFFAIAALTWFG